MNRNEDIRRAKAYANFVKATERIPIGVDVAKAIHIMWADNTTYEEVLSLTLSDFKELLGEGFSEKVSDADAARLFREFKAYMAKKEGRSPSKKTRSLSRKRRTNKTRKNTARRYHSV